MKRMLSIVLAMIVLLVPTIAFAGPADLADVRRPVDSWLYSADY